MTILEDGTIDILTPTWAPVMNLIHRLHATEAEEDHAFSYRGTTIAVSGIQSDDGDGYFIMFAEADLKKKESYGIAMMDKDEGTRNGTYLRYGDDDAHLSDDALLFRRDLENMLGLPDLDAEREGDSECSPS